MKCFFKISISIIIFFTIFFISFHKIFTLNNNDTKISIIFDNQNNMIDEIIKQAKLKIKYQFYSLKNNDIDDKYKIISNALNSYPEDFLKNNINGIIVLSELNINNEDYICEHIGKYLLIKFSIDTFYMSIEDRIHSEISEIIYENFNEYFDINNWMKLIPREENYSTKIKSLLIKNEKNMTPNNSLSQIGFINNYSKTSIKADFSQLCRYLFLRNNSLQKALSNNEILKNKYKFIIDFLNRIDKRFNNDYFNKINGNTLFF